MILTDPDRLAVAGALAVEPLDTDALVERTKRNRRQVLGAIGTLRTAGLVESDGDRYRLDIDALREAAASTAEEAIPMDPIIGFGMTEAERDVLERYFSGRTLADIPTQRAKFQIVLQRLALEFDVGRRYSEAEVNEILHPFHTDWSTLRRGLIDEGLLDRGRRDGETSYWRSGGRVLEASATR
ncbi:MAG: DUF2087 domain-containing protein [Ilumatobacteraceae bacterium]